VGRAIDLNGEVLDFGVITLNDLKLKYGSPGKRKSKK